MIKAPLPFGIFPILQWARLSVLVTCFFWVSHASAQLNIQIGGNEADFKASEIDDGTLAAFCGAGDGFVKQWWDQSGNARHASQTTTANQPKIVSSGVVILEEGKPAIQFDGINDWLSLLPIANTSAWSVFAVTRRNASGDKGIALMNELSANVPYPFYEYSDNKTYIRNAVAFGEFSSSTASQSLFSGINPDNSSGALLTLYRDAAALATSIVALAGGTEPWRSIARRTTEYGKGTLQELVVYLSDQTANRQLIEGNIAWSYSV